MKNIKEEIKVSSLITKISNAKKNMFRGEEISDVEFVRGKGIYLWDSNDNKYIDAAAGTFNLSLGYSATDVIQAVKEQCDEMIHLSSSYISRPVIEVAEKLVKISPKNLTRVTTKVSGGSTANEGAIKLAQYYTGKQDVISFYRSHLGQTVFMQTLSGMSFRRKPFKFSQHGVSHLPYPYCYRCHLDLEYPSSITYKAGSEVIGYNINKGDGTAYFFSANLLEHPTKCSLIFQDLIRRVNPNVYGFIANGQKTQVWCRINKNIKHIFVFSMSAQSQYHTVLINTQNKEYDVLKVKLPPYSTSIFRIEDRYLTSYIIKGVNEYEEINEKIELLYNDVCIFNEDSCDMLYINDKDKIIQKIVLPL